MEVKHLIFNLLPLFSFLVYTNANNYTECIYNIFVQTGEFPLAGTRANISVFLGDGSNFELPIANLRDWGLMHSSHAYFRDGGLDLFAGKEQCLRGPVCRLMVVVNSLDNWFCEFIEVTAVGVEKACSRKLFTVKKWVGVNKGPAAVIQDECLEPDPGYGPSSSDLVAGVDDFDTYGTNSFESN